MSSIPPAASDPSAIHHEPNLAPLKPQGHPVYTAAVDWLTKKGFNSKEPLSEAIVFRELKIRGLGDKLKLSFNENTGKFSFKELSLTGRLKRILHVDHGDTRLKKLKVGQTGRTAFQVFENFNAVAKLNETKLAEAASKAKEKQAEVAKASRPPPPPFVQGSDDILEETAKANAALALIHGVKIQAENYMAEEENKEDPNSAFIAELKFTIKSYSELVKKIESSHKELENNPDKIKLLKAAVRLINMSAESFNDMAFSYVPSHIPIKMA